MERAAAGSESLWLGEGWTTDLPPTSILPRKGGGDIFYVDYGEENIKKVFGDYR